MKEVSVTHDEGSEEQQRYQRAFSNTVHLQKRRRYIDQQEQEAPNADIDNKGDHPVGMIGKPDRQQDPLWGENLPPAGLRLSEEPLAPAHDCILRPGKAKYASHIRPETAPIKNRQDVFETSCR